MDTQWRNRIARLAKCGQCNSRLVPTQFKKKSAYYICPKMRTRKCNGCYIKEEDFIEQIIALLVGKKLEIVLEEQS
jgi:hypothetical protein